MPAWTLLAALASDPTFPERTPGMIEACIVDAVAAKTISKERNDHKYICAGDVAKALWDYLESANLESSEQTTENGIWLSRYFPLGGCFKRVRNVDGSPASGGLSCTVWIPHRLPAEG